MSTGRAISEHLAHLESARDWKPGDRVRVPLSGRSGTLVRRCKQRRDGWIVRWDEPMFGIEQGRVAIPNLEREGDR